MQQSLIDESIWNADNFFTQLTLLIATAEQQNIHPQKKLEGVRDETVPTPATIMKVLVLSALVDIAIILY